MEDPQEYYDALRARIDERLACVVERREPVTMYEPVRYVLGGGGKRVRPVLLLVSCEAVGGAIEDAIDAGVAVEILHNFTLVHDDIMDNADLRRGRATVHRKWDANVAILVGDQLIGIAYMCLLRTKNGDIRKLVDVFTQGMIEVCEGQSYDKEFESAPSVTEEEYLMMIGKKTGRLVAMSAELGALIGNGDDRQRVALARYATALGCAFQIQDDLLDVTGDERSFGKCVGGDILEGKKTYLLVSAMNTAEGKDRDILMHVAGRRSPWPGIVEEVTEIYRRLGVIERARERVRQDTESAIRALGDLPPGRGRDMLTWMAGMLLERTS
ncbi:MAG: polyprenyl synthetase family protein [Bacteroidota bacterium]|nr:polyprenyl synthetase family protein [Bacteroidota bacterium]